MITSHAARVAGRFERAGLQPGDRILISAGASIELLVAYVAAHRLGLITVPMNTGYSAGEIRHVVRNTAPRAAAVDDAGRGRLVGAASTGPMLVTGAYKRPREIRFVDALPRNALGKVQRDQLTRDRP